MQLTIGRKQENCSLAVRTKRVELRRLFGLLFVISIVPPIVWGLGARVAQAEDREERTVGDVGEFGAGLLDAGAQTDSARPDGDAPHGIVSPSPRESNTVAEPLSPSELYARAPRADALRAERIRTAERALLIRPFQSGDREDLVLLAQNDAPEDLPADLPADDEADDEATVDLSGIPAITAAPVLAPQVSAVGATSSSVGGRSLSTESPAVASEPAVPAPGAVVNIGSADQPASGGPRSITSADASEPAVSATAETRRRARTALHSAAAQAAAAMASDSPYRNALSGQERYQAPRNDLATIDDGLAEVSETLSFIPGLHLQSVGVFTGYSSNGISNQRNAMFSVGGDYDFGASATLAYLRNWRRTNLRVGYTPTYSRRARFQEWNTTDHRLNIGAGGQLSRRWSVGGAAAAANTGMEAFWFETPVLRFVDSPPTSFDELFRMVEAGELTDDEFASVLTGSPVVDDEGGQGFDLSRVLNVSASANARYAYSPRLSFSINGAVSNTQLLTDPLVGRRINGTGRGNIDNLSGTSISGSMAYALNRRTNLTAGHIRAQQLSSFRNNRTDNTSVGFSRRFGRSWNVGAGVGMGTVTWDNANPTVFGDSLILNQAQPGATWTATGSLGYRWRAHRFQVQASRTAGDTFGLGSRSTVQAGGGWGWSTRDALWSANASASFMKSDFGFANGEIANILTRSMGGGLTRRLSSTTALQTSYYFGEFDSPLRGLFVNNSVHRVQASFVWSPAQLR